MSMSGTAGMAGMDMSGTANMTGTGTMNMAAMDDTQVFLSDPTTWLNNPWTLLGWMLVLVAFPGNPGWDRAGSAVDRPPRHSR